MTMEESKSIVITTLSKSNLISSQVTSHPAQPKTITVRINSSNSKDEISRILNKV